MSKKLSSKLKEDNQLSEKLLKKSINFNKNKGIINCKWNSLRKKFKA